MIQAYSARTYRKKFRAYRKALALSRTALAALFAEKGRRPPRWRYQAATRDLQALQVMLARLLDTLGRSA